MHKPSSDVRVELATADFVMLITVLIGQLPDLQHNLLLAKLMDALDDFYKYYSEPPIPAPSSLDHGDEPAPS